MSDENEEVQIPKDEQAVIDAAGAETDEEKALAIAQAKLIGDL
jgi:hypothetical protein